MALELDEISLQEKFEEISAGKDELAMQEFLNHQNISDVAELIYNNEGPGAGDYFASFYTQGGKCV
ncbi:MAG: hypothetical protein WDM90_14580 [Ferruginibacter sp.]